MKKHFLRVAIVASLVCFYYSNAQEIVSFPAKIEQVKVEPLTGNIFVKTKNGLSSVNPENKQKIWEIDINKINNATTLDKLANAYDAMSNNDFLKALSPNTEIDFIANSPYVQVAFQNNNVIINNITGNVVFNAAEFGYIIYNSSFIPTKNELLILGQKDKDIVFINYNLDNNSINWTSKVESIDGLVKEFGTLLKNFWKNEVSVAENKVMLKNGTIFAGVKNLLFAINDSDGAIKWKTNYPINNFYINQTGNQVITILNSGGLLSSKQKINILNANNGDKIWKDDITTKYVSYLEDHGDKLLIAHESGFNFYDYASGNKVWKKDAKGKQIKQVIPIDNDYLYVADKEMNLIDKDGKNKWKNFVEIADNDEDQVYYLGAVDNNRVFYLTDTYGNMVDYSTGKKIWKKNIEFDKKRPLVYDVNNGKYIVYNNKRVYTFNSSNTDSPKPKGKIEVENDKNIQSLEAFDWGICIVGQNDVIGIDNEGNNLYHKTYQEPGELGRRLLKTGGILGSSYFGTRSNFNKSLSETKYVIKDSQGNTISEGDLFSENQKQQLLDKATRQANYADIINKNLLSQVNQRFNGLKQSNNYAFVLAKGQSGPELVKVRKKDGAEVAKINLDSNKPIYEIDAVTDNIYYASDNDLKIYK